MSILYQPRMLINREKELKAFCTLMRLQVGVITVYGIIVRMVKHIVYL